MIFSLEQVGLVPDLPGWHVVTSHPVDGWEQWLEVGSEGHPTSESANTIHYVFPTRIDYLRQLQLANQNGVFSPPIATPFPLVVTMRQTRLALLHHGLHAQVLAAIDALPEPDRSFVQIEWEYGGVVERFNPYVMGLAAGLSLSEEQMDQLFVFASQL